MDLGYVTAVNDFVFDGTGEEQVRKVDEDLESTGLRDDVLQR